MTTYIFAIGGTGARVLRSLTMLLASGCSGTNTTDEVVPIIIDYDGKNDDTARTQNLLQNYQDLNRAIFKNGDEYVEHFFSTPLTKIKEKTNADALQLGDAGFDPRSKFEIYIKPADNVISFAEFLKLHTMGVKNGTLPTRHLLEALYDNSDAGSKHEELNLKLDKGFKGCPNIGCVVTRRLLGSRELQNFMNVFNPQQDRILLIGSVFGGTGASGIPMLLDFFRKDPNLVNVPIGVLAVMPYFKVAEVKDAAISSSTFNAKTKAAVSAYSLPNSVYSQATAIYYIGDDGMQKPFDNHEGAAKQKNDALLPELVAAMFAVDFMTKSANDLVNGVQATPFEFALTAESADATAIRFSHFYGSTQDDFIKPLSRLMLFASFCKKYLCAGRSNNNDTWLTGAGLDKDKSFKTLLENFADKLFEWVNELEKEHRTLKLYNTQETYTKLFDYMNLEKEEFFGMRTKRAFEETDIRKELSADFDATWQAGELTDRPATMYIKNSKVAFERIYNKAENFK